MDNTTSDANCSAYKHDCAKPTWGYDISAVQVLGYCLAFTPIVNISVNAIAMVFIIRAPKLKANTRVFLCSLTVCNTLFGVVVLPFRIYSMVTAKLDGLIGKNDLLCDVSNSFDAMLRTSSLMHLSVLAFDRFLSMCRPFRRGYWLNRKINTILFTGSWVVPAILSFGVILPRLHLKGIVKEHECLHKQTKMCHYMANQSFAFTTTILGFILPAAFILLCNRCAMNTVKSREKVIFKLLHINSKRGSLNSRHFGTKLARTIFMSTSCFLCCWLPFFIINLTDPLTSYRIPVYIWFLVTWVGYANTMISPILFLKSTGRLSSRLQ